MEVVSDHKEGLFPSPKEIEYTCSCPDWAGMCKHVAAVLYGISNRLDTAPELLFTLRGVDPSELVSTKLQLDATTVESKLEEHELADIFGLDFEETVALVKGEKDDKREAARAVKPIKVKKEKRPERVTIKKTKKAAKKRTAPIVDLENLTGTDIAALRNWHGLSITELADELIMTPATIMRWEMNSGKLKLKMESKDAIQVFIKMRSKK